jgi:hypothetical protein
MRTSVADIFDEVDEDLRADRARQLLTRFAPALIGAAVLVVVLAGGWRAWQWYQAKRDAELATRYIAAMTASDGKNDAASRATAIADFAAIAETAGPGYRALSLLRVAALKVEGGDLAGANAVWDRIAADRGIDPLIRDLATLQWALHNLDTGDPATLEGRLTPLTIAPNPWHALAAEEVALLDVRRGQLAAARAAFKALSQDTTAPEGVRRRADGMLERLGS